MPIAGGVVAPRVPNARRGALNASSSPSCTPAEPHKRARSPCEDELAYRDLLERRQAHLQRVAGQAHDVRALESSVVDFLHSHTLCHTRVPPSTATSSPTSSDASSCCAAAHPRGESELSQLLQHKSAVEKKAAAALSTATAKVRAVEDDVEVNVVGGVLAERQAAVAAAERRIDHLQASKEELLRRIALTDTYIAAEVAKQAAIIEKQTASTERRGVHEEKKRQQMANVEKTRATLQQRQQAADQAVAELRRREDVSAQLQRDIEFFAARLQKQKKLKIPQ